MARKKNEEVQAEGLESVTTAEAEIQLPVVMDIPPEAEDASNSSQLTSMRNKAIAAIDKALAGKVMEAIQKKHGSSILMKASEHAARVTALIPTGIFKLDQALGGGWRVGRVHVIYGEPSSGKTTTLLKTIAQAQRMCGNCWKFPELEEGGKCCKKYRPVIVAYIDVEGTWDAEWAKFNGIDVDSLLLSTTDYAEQALDLGEALLRSHACDVLVVDSIAFLTPANEIKESTEKITMGVQARVVGSGIRKFVSALNEAGNSTGRRPTVFFTNQIRMKIGVVFGNPETTPGGKAPGFAATTEVKCNGGKYTMDETTGKALFVNLGFKIVKNKAADAKMEGEYKMMMTPTETKKKSEVYDEDDIVLAAESHGLLEKIGVSYSLLGEKFKSKEECELRLLKDRAFKHKVYTALMVLAKDLYA